MTFQPPVCFDDGRGLSDPSQFVGLFRMCLTSAEQMCSAVRKTGLSFRANTSQSYSCRLCQQGIFHCQIAVLHINCVPLIAFREQSHFISNSWCFGRNSKNHTQGIWIWGVLLEEQQQEDYQIQLNTHELLVGCTFFKHGFSFRRNKSPFFLEQVNVYTTISREIKLKVQQQD